MVTYDRLILNVNQSKMLVGAILLISALMLIQTLGISEASSYNSPILLDWDYFQDSSDTLSEYDAFLSYGIARAWTWEKIESTNCSFQILSLESQTVIFPEKSWIKPDKKNDELLNHEQRHLDILEIYNRNGITEFQKISSQEFDCTINSTDNEIEKKVSGIVMNFFNTFEQEHKEFQDKYDLEVKHGIDKIKQKQWNDKIDCLLDNYPNNDLCDI